MRAINGTIFGRLVTLTLSVAFIVGLGRAWTTAPWYLLPGEYFVTVSPSEAVLQRNGRDFDISFEYHRSLLVSGPLPVPFGVSPLTNQRLIARGVEIASTYMEANGRLYSQYCGFIDDKVHADQAVWKEATLCNSGNLRGDIRQAALVEFHRKVDAEVDSYRIALVKHAGIELGTALLGAIGVLALAAAGMWVAKGRMI
jgi:hypothetical protein